MRIVLALSLLFLSSIARSEVSIIKIQSSGKKAHVLLDTVKDYQVGDVINFYQDRTLVSQAKITFLTPRKTKAVVEVYRGTALSNNLWARARNSNPERQIAQDTAPKKKRRQPAVYGNTRPVQMRTSHSGRGTQDLLYYPEENSFLLSTKALYGQDTLKLDGQTNIKGTRAGISPILFYAPIPKLALGLGLGYASVTNETSGTSDSASGMTDPSLYVQYQLKSPEIDDFQWFLSTEISPSIGKKDENNVLRGNTLIRVGTLLGMRHGAISWTASPSIGYYTETKEDNAEMDSYFDVALDGELQYDFNQQWAIYSPLLFSYTGEQSAKDGSYKILSFFTLGAGLGFKFAASEKFNIFFNTLYAITPSLTVETTSPALSINGSQSGFDINLGANLRF
ncbi:MAG: hypothetical protein R3A80_12250 [Bdellovibrionota bacterium]